MAAPARDSSLEQAPVYAVPTRRLGALEHPMIIKDIDKGIKTFGQNHALEAVRILSIGVSSLSNKTQILTHI